MSKIKKFKAVTLKISRILFITLGVSFFIFLVLACTSLPFWARYNMGHKFAPLPHQKINTIIVMGAGGFPSEMVLMRLWYTAECAKRFPDAKIIITTPGDTLRQNSTILLMRKYLEELNVPRTKIILENKGLNTRHQAICTREFYEEGLIKPPFLIVTSPEHIPRSVLSFRKIGITETFGQPTLEAMLETDLRISRDKLGGNEFMPYTGGSISLRYKFWDYLKYEIIIVREYIALSIYKLKGWI